MPNYGRYKYLLVEKRDGVALVTLNRPERLNAFFSVMHREVEDVMADLSEDADVRAVVLTGAGRAFCAGGDIRVMQESGQEDPQGVLGSPRHVHSPKRLVQNILTVRQPIICAVNGPCIGVGATVALFCDVVIMAESARIGDPHVKIGLVAGDGGAAIWPLLVGLNRAKELLMTGELITAQEAYRIGLVNRVVPDGEVVKAAMELARKLADGPTLAIQWTKLSVNKILNFITELTFDTSLALEGITMASQDFHEGTSAFLEKRPARFKGK